MKLSKKLTPQQHAELAEKLNRIEAELRQMRDIIQREYGFSSYTVKTLEKLLRSGAMLSRIRADLDGYFCEEGHSFHSLKRLQEGKPALRDPYYNSAELSEYLLDQQQTKDHS
jgi:hypothetical protein